MGCESDPVLSRSTGHFQTQLRAILRASCVGNVKIMYPMISNVDEVIRANTFLDQAKHELRSRACRSTKTSK
jgi:phosphoenolpyruvate-protein kinase (PTS system EI component)